MAETVIYPALFSTVKNDEDGREYVDYTEVGPSRPGEASALASGRCVGAEDPITLDEYDPDRPGLVLQPEIGPGHCFQDEPGKTDILQEIWNNGNPKTRLALSDENKAYLESRIEPPYPWEPRQLRMRVELDDRRTLEIPCDENARIDGGTLFTQATLRTAVRIVIPEGVTTIRAYAFDGCTSLASITLPETVTTIKQGAFEACTSLASITLPAGVTTFGLWAFRGCTSLASITLPETVTAIGAEAFDGCTSLASITLPAGLTSIKPGAFRGCTSLASITIPEGVTTIGLWAFRGCTGLKSIIFPSSVETYGDGIFNGCTSLQRIYVANDSGRQEVDFLVDPSVVTIYRNFSHNQAIAHTFLDADADNRRPHGNAFSGDPEVPQGPPASRARTEGALYDWTGGET